MVIVMHGDIEREVGVTDAFYIFTESHGADAQGAQGGSRGIEVVRNRGPFYTDAQQARLARVGSQPARSGQEGSAWASLAGVERHRVSMAALRERRPGAAQEEPESMPLP